MNVQQKKVLAGFAAAVVVLFVGGLVVDTVGSVKPAADVVTVTTVAAIPASTVPVGTVPTTTAKPAPTTTAKPAMSPSLQGEWVKFLGKVTNQLDVNAAAFKRGDLAAGQRGCLDLVGVMTNVPSGTFGDALLARRLKTYEDEMLEMAYACMVLDLRGTEVHMTAATAALQAATERMKALAGS